jgi:hypothetical protein
MQYKPTALTGFTKDAKEIRLKTGGKWFSIRTYDLRIIFCRTKTVGVLGPSNIFIHVKGA